MLKEFEEDIKEKIPLAKDLEFKLLSFEKGELTLAAPKEKNKNDKNTVFAGSQASLALLAGWSLVTLTFQSYGVTSVAAVKTEMFYKKPIESDFKVRSCFAKGADIEACKATLDRKGRAKILVDVDLYEVDDEQVKASFQGSYFLSL